MMNTRFLKVVRWVSQISHSNSNIVKYSLVGLIIICIILPLRCPTGRGYHYVTFSHLEEDIYVCDIGGKESSTSLQTCPLIPKNLERYSSVKTSVNETALKTLSQKLSIKPGGKWKPTHCNPQHHVALIVPYRDRKLQLDVFLKHIHPFLQKQLLNYGIYVVEQSSIHKFNRAKLFNIGFVEALKDSNYCCFIFHDVDLLPESPRHIYTCSKQPRHMCSALDTFRYVLPYPGLFGGVIAITRHQFERVNGFSNVFFGWGGEDDDFCNRILNMGYSITRWEPSLSRYTMLFHSKAVPDPNRIHFLRSGYQRYSTDGLNSLKYKVVERQHKSLYTWLLVDVKPE
ncbi:beta-1,4-N-acetylgalactosaminyltransferase bre-4-like [Limulus polyphemus]|uniref:Beta-1,4-N-acetylgalactosaminyltransferase n=1 Tax=Limulus polyphemus TaxID=6850 RepID=A0ABM1BVA8_LIMPO|nr:beta-1,4-N-acetylgalactosaminyltransferase bre-4-like [Limulus polyphemus]XP_013789362.1 beta-1,4-N-acetylgalactosaminyltransferase bre-4-like [Limulus polyphemus]XP_022257407.1 beta-1,4-N-acetylgalactosaminyltransferase bre-4-like [Limulus polyphemus]XP_022257409.1 beta-1,4-N-acetylgalactosaminyltransferase bre-4-like [Limulus polyphemus]